MLFRAVGDILKKSAPAELGAVPVVLSNPGLPKYFRNEVFRNISAVRIRYADFQIVVCHE
ncbi:MAG: hypothetical protein UY71_C0001G0006 [Parcubacteria group bacterium GW2011_GWB1_52_7]|nr:MAG: hypothetical protein UY71_C0001G0006 [Parcubacteria group bacterium GW2011_GWB1_52_7]